jgi:hypothetical protein
MDSYFGVQFPPFGYVQGSLTASLTHNFLNNPTFPLTLQEYGAVDLTPVTLASRIGVKFTPIPILVLDTELMQGFGWPIPAFKAYGTGVGTMTNESGIHNMPFNTNGFQVNDTTTTATLQFDFGYLFPGNWTHVLVQSSHQLCYHQSTVKDGEGWVYQNTDYREGWDYNASFTLGYAFPAVPVLDMIVGQYEYGRKVVIGHLETYRLTGAIILKPFKKLTLLLGVRYNRLDNLYYGDEPWAGVMTINYLIF